MDRLTLEEFKSSLPVTLKNSVNSNVIDLINTQLSDPDMYETYRENMLSFTSVMREGKFKLSSYVNGVKYVSHRMRGKNRRQAFTITFPDKVNDWNSRDIEGKDQASYITAYDKSKLVTLLYAETMVPTHILNHDNYQKAINQLAYLMIHAKSEKVQSDSAAHIIRELKPPETKKYELDIGVKDNKEIDALRESVKALTEAQRSQILNGNQNAKDIAKQPIIVNMDKADD